MTTHNDRRHQAPFAGSRPLGRRLALALAAAVGGNLVLSQVLAAAVDADPDFLALQAGPVAVASAVGVLLGAALYAVLRRLRRPRLLVRWSRRAPCSARRPLGLLGATQAEQPGVSDAAALALIPLHLLVAVVRAVVLPVRNR
jgi:hypothetical protein